MSLPHMQWRYVGARSFGTVNPMAAMLDELHTLGTSPSYADGTSRSPGAGSAGTWTKVTVANVTECLHVAPPVNALNTRIMIAGATYTPSPSPTMHAPDSYGANNLMVNLVKNAGAFINWQHGSPFTTGQTFGWGKWWSTANGSTGGPSVGTVYLWEGREAIAVIATNSSGGNARGFIAGAIIDPESTDTTVDAESDGRMYGVVRTGPSTGISSTFHNDTNATFSANQYSYANRFLATMNSNDQPFCAVFAPGVATLLQMNPMMVFPVSPSPTGLKTRSGAFARLAIAWRGTTADNIFGRFREVFFYSDGQLPARQMDGPNPVGYIYCGSSVSQVDSLLLEH